MLLLNSVSWSIDVLAYNHSNISLNFLAVYFLDLAAQEVLIIGLMGQNTSSCVSLQRERWFVGWAEYAYFLSSFKLHERWVNSVETLYKTKDAQISVKFKFF